MVSHGLLWYLWASLWKMMHLLSKNIDFSALVYFFKSKRVNVNIVYSVPKNSTIWSISIIFDIKKIVETLWRDFLLIFLFTIVFYIDFSFHCQNLLKSLSINIQVRLLMKHFDEAVHLYEEMVQEPQRSMT